VTKAGRGQFGELTQLQERILASRFTDAGVEHPQGLLELQNLDIQAGSVTDVGLEGIGRLIQLRYLCLDNNGDRVETEP